jgi:hypothetical protein
MERLSVEHGVRAMQSAGFSVKLAKRDPSALPVEILPVVLLVKQLPKMGEDDYENV